MAGFEYRSGPYQVKYFPESSGTANDWYAGDPVYLSSGRLDIAANSTSLLGVSMAAATGTIDTQCPVILFDPMTQWAINVDSATTPAQATHVGTDYGLTVSTGATVLNLAGATAQGFRVVSLDRRDVAAAGSRVNVQITYASVQSIAT